MEWCKMPEVGLPEPDAVIYLTLSAEEAAKRGAYGGERFVIIINIFICIFFYICLKKVPKCSNKVAAIYLYMFIFI